MPWVSLIDHPLAMNFLELCEADHLLSTLGSQRPGVNERVADFQEILAKKDEAEIGVGLKICGACHHEKR